MKLSYTDILGGGERHEVTATITTDHAASSYGQPVIVLDSDNEALDMTSWILLNYQIIEATPDEIEQLERVLIFDPRLTAAELGRRGGLATSEAKRRASRENGKKGGRPKKKRE